MDAVGSWKPNAGNASMQAALIFTRVPAMPPPSHAAQMPQARQRSPRENELNV
jgi:hypothetical protein